jgi:predicted SnoaL-like aldol condensation-catalyzing enzyme
MTTGDVATAYITAFCSGNYERARELVAEDFSFHGPFIQASSRDEFFAGAAPLQPLLRGHRLLREWDDDGEVCAIYDMQLETPAGSGAVTICDWLKVQGGHVVSERLVFDTAEFNAIVPR